VRAGPVAALLAVLVELAACGDNHHGEASGDAGVSRDAGNSCDDALPQAEVEVWAVGPGGQIWNRQATWQEIESPTGVELHAVWGAAPDDVWAVGDGGTIIHWDGSVWSEAPSGVEVALHDVGGSAADDAWAVGGGGTILHWNGDAWSEVPSGVPDDLVAVWAGARGFAYAAGPTGALLAWDGDSWQLEKVSTRPVVIRDLDGLSATELWAIGEERRECLDCGSDECDDCQNDVVLRRGPAGWEERFVVRAGESSLGRIAVAGADEVWVTGAYCFQPGVISRLEQRLWSDEQAGLAGTGRAMWAARPDAVWVADDGAVRRRTADGWVVEVGPVRVNALWGPSFVRGECEPDPDLSEEPGHTLRTSPCFAVMCEGGLCDSLDSDGACACPFGRHPEERACVADDPCTGVTCSERGTCVVAGDAPTCDCDDDRVDHGGTLCGELPRDATCSEDGWCIVSPFPAHGTSAVRATGPDNVWIGPLARRIAGGWQRLDLGIDGAVIDFDGTGADDMWFLTEREIYHWDGTSTARVPFDCSFGAHGVRTMDRFYRLAAASPGEVWVSGERTLYSFPGFADGVCRFDGRRWQAAESGVSDTAWGSCALGGSCTALFAAAPGEMWCGASRRWDGTAFVPLPDSPAGTIADVWGASADDVWAIAGERIHHFDGLAWTDAGVSRVVRIDGAARDDVWAVGERVWHFDGDGWESRGTLAQFTPYYHGRGVAALGGGEALVGVADHLYRYTPGGRVDESSWRPGGGTSLWGAAADDLWLGGNGLWHWNGARWTNVRARGLNAEVWDLFGFAADDVWAVGFSEGSISWLGHFDGGSWTTGRAVDLDLGNAPDDRTIRSVHGEASDDLWIGGVERGPERGFVAHWDGVAWQSRSAPGEIYALWAGNGELWAAMEGGVIGRWRDNAWTTFAPPADRPVRNVFGFAADNVWVVGSYGYVGHFDGVAWTEVASGTDAHLLDLWGPAPDDLWAAGDGVILHWDGRSWSVESLPLPADDRLRTVFGIDGTMWAIGTYLLRRP